MKLKSIQIVIDDYRKQVNEDNHIKHTDGLEKFYYPESRANSPLIEPLGTKCVQDLVKFIKSTYFPTDGSFIDYVEEGDELADIEVARKLKSKFNEHVLNSNFHEKMSPFLKHGLVYGKSFLDTEWANGLNFLCPNNESMFMSKDALVQNKRLYVEEEYTGADIRSMYTYDSLPEVLTASMGMDKDDVKDMLFTVVKAIVPVNDTFFDRPSRKNNKNYKEINFLPNFPSELVPIGGDEGSYLKSIMAIEYRPDEITSLGILGLSPLIRLEAIELDKRDYAEIVINPPRHIPEGIFEAGSYNFGRAGITVRKNNEPEPGTLDIAGELPYSIEEVQKLRQDVKDIFMWDIMQQAKLTSISQGEAAANKLMAIEEIEPLVSTLLIKSMNALFTRIDNLLMKNDKEYRKLRKSLSGSIKIECANTLKRKLKNRVGLMQLAQGGVPFLQMDQQAAFKIDGVTSLNLLADSLGVTEALYSDTEAAESLQTAVRQQQQQQAMEQEKLAAETEKTLSETGQE